MKDGTPMDELGQMLFDHMLDVASGTRSVGERAGHSQVLLSPSPSISRSSLYSFRPALEKYVKLSFRFQSGETGRSTIVPSYMSLTNDQSSYQVLIIFSSCFSLFLFSTFYFFL